MIFQFFLAIIYSISSKSLPLPRFVSLASDRMSWKFRKFLPLAAQHWKCLPQSSVLRGSGRAWLPSDISSSRGMDTRPRTWTLGWWCFFFGPGGEKPDRINGIVIEFGGVRVESCNEHVYKWHILRQLREQVGVVWAFRGLKWSSHVSFCTLNCLLPSPSWATKQEDKRRTWTPISP